MRILLMSLTITGSPQVTMVLRSNKPIIGQKHSKAKMHFSTPNINLS